MWQTVSVSPTGQESLNVPTHSLPSRRRARRTVTGLLSLTLASAATPSALADPAAPADQSAPQPAAPVAPPAPVDPADIPVDTSPLPTDDADALLDRLSAVSAQSQAVSDRVQEVTSGIGLAQQERDRAAAEVERTSREAEAAQAQAAASAKDVTELSNAKYRGATAEQVAAIAGAGTPQAAVDRAAYINALRANDRATQTRMRESLEKAASAKSAAMRAKATADFSVSDLRHRQQELAERTSQLDTLRDQITAAVDGMSPEQKQRWVDRHGPIDVDVQTFLGQVQEAVSSGPLGSAGDVAQAVTGAVQAALGKLGAPYSWGAAGPDAFDCSGLMYWAYQQQGKSIPRTSQAQVSGGTPVSRDALQPGDIVGFYPGVTHVGMYIGDGKIVHASDYGIPVQVSSVDSMPFAGAARY